MSPRRTEEERAGIERQAVAQSKLREAVAAYLAAHDVPQDVAFEIATESSVKYGVGFMEEVFNHVDDLIDDIDVRGYGLGETVTPVIKVGGAE